MKKLLAVLIVLCAATAVFAEETATKLNVGASGFVFGNNYNQIVKDKNGDFGEARIQPLFTITNDSFDVVLKLRIDEEFGSKTEDTSVEETGTSTNYSSGTKQKAIKVVNAYAKSKVAGVEGLTLAGGIMSYDFPLIYSDNMPMFNATYAFDPVTIALYYGKLSEENAQKSSDDSQVYIADATVKFGESSIRPAFFYHQIKKNSLDNSDVVEGNGFIYALNASIVAGSFGIDATGVYANAKDTSGTEDVKYTGYAFDIAPFIKVAESVKISAFMTMFSGDKGTSATKNKSFLDSTLDPSSGTNNLRLYILEDCGTFGSQSDVTGGAVMRYSNNDGYSAYGLAIDGAFGPITAKLQGAYAKANQATSGVKKDLGIEIDANIGYALTNVSTLYVEAAYLKTGKYFEQGGTVDTQNAQYVNVGMTFSL